MLLFVVVVVVVILYNRVVHGSYYVQAGELALGTRAWCLLARVCARACSGRQAKFYLDVIGLVVEGDEGADNTLENGPEQEGKEEGEVHDVAADGRRQKDERQAVPVHAVQILAIARAAGSET